VKIAIDLEKVITADKNSAEFFRIMTYLLIPEHKIYILTNKEQDIAQELDCCGIEYNEIVITDSKSDYIRDNNITVVFDNCELQFMS
jgi:hypothetical protein